MKSVPSETHSTGNSCCVPSDPADALNKTIDKTDILEHYRQDPTQAPTQSIPSTANPAANGGSKSLPAPAIPTARSTPAIEQVGILFKFQNDQIIFHFSPLKEIFLSLITEK